MHPENPYQSSDPFDENPNLSHWDKNPWQNRGIGRLIFFLLSLANNFFWGCLLLEMINSESMDFYWAIVIGNAAAAVYLRVQRLKNLGYHWAWLFGLLIPGLNFLVVFLFFAGPAGFAHHRTLDAAGRTIAWTCVILVILSLLVFAKLFW